MRAAFLPPPAGRGVVVQPPQGKPGERGFPGTTQRVR